MMTHDIIQSTSGVSVSPSAKWRVMMDSSSCALVKVRTTCVKHLELCILYLAQRQCPKDVRVLLSNLMVRCIVCTHMHQAHTHS